MYGRHTAASVFLAAAPQVFMEVVFLSVFVDCFRRDVRQASRFVSFVNLYLQPAGNLLGRPTQPEARFNELSGLLVSRKLRAAGIVSCI